MKVVYNANPNGYFIFTGTAINDGQILQMSAADIAAYKGPQMIAAADAQNPELQKFIYFNNSNQKKMYGNNGQNVGITVADQKGTPRMVRQEVNAQIPEVQRLLITIDATGWTPATGVNKELYFQIGGGVKCANLLALPAKPDEVEISGIDGVNTIANFNDFAQNGYVIKELQISANSADIFDTSLKPVRKFSLPNETASQLIISNFDLNAGLTPADLNTKLRNDPRFYAKCDKLQGMILGVYAGYRITYNFSFYSSANAAQMFVLADR